jgi:hypothetical protein
MIFYASQRGSSSELAKHLLNGDQNEHVAVHEIRGFVADNLPDALKEAHAVSRGTRCRQFLFSVSLNPPETEYVPIEDFEAAIERIEQKMGLSGQPRIIVFHEKHGRRHCHAVWSRIDADKLTAVNLPYFKRKLTELSADLFAEHGWKMPKGLEKHAGKNGTVEKDADVSATEDVSAQKSPFNMEREEYRQAQRLSEDPQALKAILREAWEGSDSKDTFGRALEEQGFFLARGDRRGYVALDINGGVFSLTRWLDIGTRELKARLGPPDGLPDIEQAKEFLSSRMTESLKLRLAEARQEAKARRTPLVRELRALTLRHREDRQDLLRQQQKRWREETIARSRRLSRGVKGIWERLSGRYQEIREQNEAETISGLARDRQETETLIRGQIQARRQLQKAVLFYRSEERQESRRLREEIAGHITSATEPSLQAFEKATDTQKVILATELANVEAKISIVSGDIGVLQASLDNALLSDEMRVKIRHMIEKIIMALHLEAEEERQDEREEEEEEEFLAWIAQYNALVQRAVELQEKLAEEEQRIAANRELYDAVQGMSYSLNGIPPWQITVAAPPPDQRLDEKAYIQTLRQYSNRELLDAIRKPAKATKPAPLRASFNKVQKPDTGQAVTELRQNVLQVKEVLRRANKLPDDGKPLSVIETKTSLPQTATIKFDATKPQ